MKQVALLLIIFLICSCKQNSKDTESLHGKIGTAEELRKAIKESGNDANQIFEPIRANISELEAEINNGGFNQYFFNSSGQNCFETLKALEEKNDEHSILLADLLKKSYRNHKC